MLHSTGMEVFNATDVAVQYGQHSIAQSRAGYSFECKRTSPEARTIQTTCYHGGARSQREQEDEDFHGEPQVAKVHPKFCAQAIAQRERSAAW
jgi:hypothetical protein